MVKGTTRQVVLVKSPDPQLFEQAIFILRENALENHGMSEEEIMLQARKTAGTYISNQLPRRRRNAWLKNGLWLLLGAALGAAICCLIRMG